MRISHRETALIADNLGQMLKVGMPLDKVFGILLRHKRSRRARRAIMTLRDTVMSGRRFYEGLAARARLWPRYFIELTRCSEQAGLLHAGFTEGADHFRKLAKVWRTVHMAWISPVCIILFCWFLRGLARIYFHHSVEECLEFWMNRIISALPPVCIVLAVVFIRPIRNVFDRIALYLPILSETIRDLDLYRFTSCFRYLYIGAVTAPEIVRMSAHAMSNSFLRGRLKESATGIEQGQKFAEALAPATEWPSGYINSLMAAETAGSLDTILEKLAEERRVALDTRMFYVRSISERIVTYGSVFVLALEFVRLAMSRQW